MFDLEILVLELFAINRFAAGAVPRGEVSTLNHKGLYNTVERRAFPCRISMFAMNLDISCISLTFVAQRFSRLASPLLSST